MLTGEATQCLVKVMPKSANNKNNKNNTNSHSRKLFLYFLTNDFAFFFNAVIIISIPMILFRVSALC